jgi:hypothetical protein
MIKATQMRGFSPRTHASYLLAVRGLAKYTRRSPDLLQREDLRGYFEHLVTERKVAPTSVRLSYNGIRFLYLQVLAWPALDLEVALPKRPQRIPGLLTRAEVAAPGVGWLDPDVRSQAGLPFAEGALNGRSWPARDIAKGGDVGGSG